MLKMIRRKWVLRGWRNIARLEIDSGGSQGPAWTAQPIEKRRRNSQFRLVEAKIFSMRNF
jgi:hypothetical protein